MSREEPQSAVTQAVLRAFVKIGLAIVYLFPLLTVVEQIRAMFGDGAGLIALVVTLLVGLYVVENAANWTMRKLIGGNHDQ